jgi:hypothetical protein
MGRREESKVVPLDAVADSEAESLSYSIELWTVARDAVERELARASSPELGRAIFKAATAEHPGRRITLRRGTRTISETEG